MKKIIALSGIVILLNAGMVFAQRNANQKRIKTQNEESPSKAGVLNDEEYQQYNAPAANALSNSNGAYNQSYTTYPYYYQNDNEIVLNVKALMNAKATGFLAVFNLTQVGQTAAKTNELMNTRINNFLAAVKQLGISEKDIYIDMIYLVPTFEYDAQKKLFSKTTYNEIPTGFEMQKNIHIRFNDINKVADLVTLAANNEIYDLVKVDYFVESTQKMYDSLRNECVKNILTREAALKKLNLNLSDKYEIISEHNYTIYPETQYPDYDAFVSQSVDAATNESGVTSIRKPKTVAYDQYPYNSFDIIINPDILEPVIQFVYNLKVKFTLIKPEAGPKNNYIVITPSGEMKTLDIK
jgi:uncharacterized protein YggE